MSKQCITFYARNLFFAIALFSTLFVLGPVQATGFNKNPCTDAQYLPLNTKWNGYGESVGEVYFFRLEIPTAGLLTVDVAVSGSADAEAKLGYFGPNCEAATRSGDLIAISETPTGVIALSETAGTHVFGVAPQDSQQTLDRFTLATGFVSMEDLHDKNSHQESAAKRDTGDNAESPTEIEVEPNREGVPDLPFKHNNEQNAESPTEIEVEPNREGIPSLPLKNNDGQDAESPTEIEVEPNREGVPSLPLKNNDEQDAESPTEIEVEPNLHGDGLLHDPRPPSYVTRLVARKLCHQLGIDDHADTPLCATPIHPGDKIRGELFSSWGDDQDLFVFELSESQTLYFQTTGSTDTFGSLYDRQGNKLAMDDNGGSLNNFRIVKTLGPGLYYLRVEGAFHTEGSYELRFDMTAW